MLNAPDLPDFILQGGADLYSAQVEKEAASAKIERLKALLKAKD